MHFVIILYYKVGGGKLAFQIKPDRKETEIKSIRFPLALIDEIEEAIRGKDVSFSGFILQACKYALENMDTDTDNG